MRLLPYLLACAFAAWCIASLRTDLTQLSAAPVTRSWDLLVLASLLSLANYGLRILRWRAYLQRLGHPLAWGFAALSFTAGFAYTLSPGKVGEMMRARYYRPLGVPLGHVSAAFFAERLMDVVAMVALAALVFSASARYRGLIVGAGCVALIALLGLAAWALEGLGLGVLSSLAPGGQVAVPTAVGIYAVAVLAALLAAQGLAVSQALLVTLACGLVTLWLAVCLGWLAVLALRPRTVSMVAPPWQ